MLGALKLVRQEVAEHWRRLLLMGVAFALLFQVLMLLALIVRFQALPNYAHFFDWIGSAFHIIQSTPSWSDALKIVSEEWLIEIGQMNYDYGAGLSIWSLNVIPSRLLVLTAQGALVALAMRLYSRRLCAMQSKNGALAAMGGGAAMVAMTNVTMCWVVCCATPTWVVGLAMLGLGVSTSLALETMGPALSTTGFLLLFIACVALAWTPANKAAITVSEPEHA